MPAEAALARVPPGALGHYRLRDPSATLLLYLGEGQITARLRAHLQKRFLPGHAQGAVVAATGAIECSSVVQVAWRPHQRLELETDLIGAYVLAVGPPPPAQFLG